jgi:hypothetical protein
MMEYLWIDSAYDGEQFDIPKVQWYEGQYPRCIFSPEMFCSDVSLGPMSMKTKPFSCRITLIK